MIVRQKKRGVPPVLLYSLAGGLLVVVGLIVGIRASLVTEPVKQCAERYARATHLPYRSRDGAMLTTAELQARLLERDWGLQAHGTIRRVSGAPASEVLEVALPEGGVDGGTTANPVSGVGFAWTPGSVRQARRACLTYSVWLPEDFDYGPGGVLPGLFGGSQSGPMTADGKRSYFAVRPVWQNNGRAAAYLATPTDARGRRQALDGAPVVVPRGRWVPIAEEIVLNTPGKSDGRIRLWVDGELKLDHERLAIRDSDALGFEGVSANVHYAPAGKADWAPAPAETYLRLSPFVVHWE